MARVEINVSSSPLSGWKLLKEGVFKRIVGKVKEIGAFYSSTIYFGLWKLTEI